MFIADDLQCLPRSVRSVTAEYCAPTGLIVGLVRLAINIWLPRS
jgi:hypothetical protein